jgi:hypothetical protein
LFFVKKRTMPGNFQKRTVTIKMQVVPAKSWRKSLRGMNDVTGTGVEGATSVGRIIRGVDGGRRGTGAI